ncbi:hypothetical protein HDU93_000080 [Gonapodya sp. JEL0774]|nr:hypothetical protein HDU93_000080 [Gonapodya sp. JEL0774]
MAAAAAHCRDPPCLEGNINGGDMYDAHEKDTHTMHRFSKPPIENSLSDATLVSDTSSSSPQPSVHPAPARPCSTPSTPSAAPHAAPAVCPASPPLVASQTPGPSLPVPKYALNHRNARAVRLASSPFLPPDAYVFSNGRVWTEANCAATIPPIVGFRPRARQVQVLAGSTTGGQGKGVLVVSKDPVRELARLVKEFKVKDAKRNTSEKSGSATGHTVVSTSQFHTTTDLDHELPASSTTDSKNEEASPKCIDVIGIEIGNRNPIPMGASPGHNHDEAPPLTLNSADFLIDIESIDPIEDDATQSTPQVTTGMTIPVDFTTRSGRPSISLIALAKEAPETTAALTRADEALIRDLLKAAMRPLPTSASPIDGKETEDEDDEEAVELADECDTTPRKKLRSVCAQPPDTLNGDAFRFGNVFPDVDADDATVGSSRSSAHSLTSASVSVSRMDTVSSCSETTSSTSSSSAISQTRSSTPSTPLSALFPSNSRIPPSPTQTSSASVGISASGRAPSTDRSSKRKRAIPSPSTPLLPASSPSAPPLPPGVFPTLRNTVRGRETHLVKNPVKELEKYKEERAKWTQGEVRMFQRGLKTWGKCFEKVARGMEGETCEMAVTADGGGVDERERLKDKPLTGSAPINVPTPSSNQHTKTVSDCVEFFYLRKHTLSWWVEHKRAKERKKGKERNRDITKTRLWRQIEKGVEKRKREVQAREEEGRRARQARRAKSALNGARRSGEGRRGRVDDGDGGWYGGSECEGENDWSGLGDVDVDALSSACGDPDGDGCGSDLDGETWAKHTLSPDEYRWVNIEGWDVYGLDGSEGPGWEDIVEGPCRVTDLGGPLDKATVVDTPATPVTPTTPTVLPVTPITDSFSIGTISTPPASPSNIQGAGLPEPPAATSSTSTPQPTASTLVPSQPIRQESLLPPLAAPIPRKPRGPLPPPLVIRRLSPTPSVQSQSLFTGQSEVPSPASSTWQTPEIAGGVSPLRSPGSLKDVGQPVRKMTPGSAASPAAAVVKRGWPGVGGGFGPGAVWGVEVTHKKLGLAGYEALTSPDKRKRVEESRELEEMSHTSASVKRTKAREPQEEHCEG